MKDLYNNNEAIALDLSDFAQLLESNGLIQDSKSLYDASEKLRTSKDKSIWQYECNNLKFSVSGSVAGTIPQYIELVDIVFNIFIQGSYTDEKLCKNPLTKLSFDIELEGWDAKPNLFYGSWHLDKHIHVAGNGQSTYIHPEYHLTFGGNRLEAKGDIFGSSLILPSPRISYPPMDAILGIDFILQNYFPLNLISKILDESKYKQIVRNSQNRLWKNYYLSISNAWDNSVKVSFEKGFDFFNLNPHISK
jgi:hypothetical protein